MAKLAQHAQAIVILVQVVVCVKPVNQGSVYKAINATHALQELIWTVKLAQIVKATVLPAQAVLFVKLARQDLVYKATNVILVLLELT